MWSSVYTDRLASIPWYVTIGNHDWRHGPDAELAYFASHKLWVAPDLFSQHVISVENWSVHLIMTNLLEYGYEGPPEAPKGTFERYGWTLAYRTMEKQLD
jgi:hypothetical protein